MSALPAADMLNLLFSVKAQQLQLKHQQEMQELHALHAQQQMAQQQQQSNIHFAASRLLPPMFSSKAIDFTALGMLNHEAIAAALGRNN
jgi:ribosome biogenesis protein Tsr3